MKNILISLTYLSLIAIVTPNCSNPPNVISKAIPADSQNPDTQDPETQPTTPQPPVNEFQGYVPPNSVNWTRFPQNLIINPSQFKMEPTGESGFNVADPCVMFDKKSGLWHAFFSSSIESLDIQVLKHAKSQDGTDWTIYNTAALEIGTTNSWDSKSVETCAVTSIEVSPGIYKYFLFYSGTDTLEGGDKDIYKMGLAVSDDLDTFTRIDSTISPKGEKGLLFDSIDAFPGNPNIISGIVTDPTLINRNGNLQMWFFCAGKNSQDQYIDGGICYATSNDGMHWTQNGSQSSLLNDQTLGVIAQQPTVVFNSKKNKYEMWVVIDDPEYLPYGVPGLAVGGYYYVSSTDGINWIYSNKTSYDFSWNKNLESENEGLVTGPEVVLKDGIYYLFYPSFTSQNITNTYMYPFTWGLNLATKSE
ncbi:MAG: hypothetical protein H6625_00315 [Bdellovibrionaceae bacterium]|nr:hypothetical protein [Pseudobdellovibrionaceae bacterium]